MSKYANKHLKPRQQDYPSLDDAESLDSMKLYLKEIGRYDLLSKQQERDLFMRLEQGDEEARQAIINANLRLVVAVARSYVGGSHAHLQDLVQEGNIGLFRAVSKFDYRKGFAFSTYATWWIRQAIARALPEQHRTIKLPVHIHERIKKLAKQRLEFEYELGREATRAELAAYAHCDEDAVFDYEVWAYDVLSLDAPLQGDGHSQYDGNDNTLGDMLEDTRLSVHQEAEHAILIEQIALALSTLDEREASIIRKRYGLLGENKMTFEECALEFSRTRERIRQIEVKGLYKLKQRLKRDVVLEG